MTLPQGQEHGHAQKHAHALDFGLDRNPHALLLVSFASASSMQLLVRQMVVVALALAVLVVVVVALVAVAMAVPGLMKTNSVMALEQLRGKSALPCPPLLDGLPCHQHDAPHVVALANHQQVAPLQA